ncbi:MAG: hypothetical protein A2V66_06620 [Ignavibacteria bacterium RBG_13_36_8]|nr:MAG: hypothetical protein A2V66_06620 [Ignavibacteria bacterium RBG_13_36_8]
MRKSYSSFILLIVAFTLLRCSGDSGTEPQPDPGDIKILFIGSSFTYHYDTPGLFRQLAEAAGKNVFVVDKCIGDASLTYHSMYGPTIEAIYVQQWDYVILENCDYNIVSPDTYFDERPVNVLGSFILDNNPDTKIILFLIWSRSCGYDEYSFDELSEMLRDGTKTVADRHDMLIAPVGWAWKRTVDENPYIYMYQWDGMHPSLAGAYLQACVYFSTIFTESCEGNSFSAGLPVEHTSYLQQVASETVLDDLEYWNLTD